MATLVLSTVGTLVGGPIGGAIGALIGQAVDARVFAPKGRQGPRLGDLTVQTSSYGSAIPKVFGTMRVAGTVIWATDLREDRTKQGGGKGRPSSTTYSYSASFAVALSGRRIGRVRRIWADGKLLRGEAGDFKTETGFRLHVGGEDQAVDPGIAAAEGVGSAPAFRGMAYAVFEDFQLGDYGNRIPSLTFEVVADAGGTSTGAIVAAVSGGGIAAAMGVGLAGFAAHGDSVRSVVAVLGEAVPAPLYDDGATLRQGVSEAAVVTVSGSMSEARRAAGAQVPDAVSLGYYDVARDYQAGLQQAAHRTGGTGTRTERLTLPAAMGAETAKAVAAARLDHHWRSRERRTLTLPWRDIGVRPGRLVRIAGDAQSGHGPGRVWLVTGWTVERMAVRLELVAHAGARLASLPAVAGRAAAARDEVHGPTVLRLFDAPQLGETAAAGPRLFVAAAGGPGWRGAVLEASGDGGASWTGADWFGAGGTAPAAVMGTAVDALGDGGSTLFDLRNGVEIALLHDEMWLESRDDDALVAGANLAMIGDELVQFGAAERLGPARYRLSRLLRGRRGTEWAAAGHVAGEPFTMMTADTLVSLPWPAAAIGGSASVAARGIGDDAPTVATATIGVEAVRPPAPVHLRVSRGEGSGQVGGAVEIGWTRRSRAGWAWIDGVDAAIGEDREAYRVTIDFGGGARAAEVGAPGFLYDAAAQAADGVVAGSMLTVRVVQLGAVAASRPVVATFRL